MRYEYKYVVSNNLIDELRSRIKPFVVEDSYMGMVGPDGYTVRSIYLDSPKYDYYREQIDSMKIRKKIRIRGYNLYNSESIVFLEIKRKNEKAIKKFRAPLYYRNLGDLLNNGDFARYILTEKGINNAIENSRRFLFHVHSKSLKPTVLIIYKREAYLNRFDPSVRITFDKNLRNIFHPDITMLFKEDNVHYYCRRHFILEIKFSDNFPRWLSPILGSLGLKYQSFSKYTNCFYEHIACNGFVPPSSLACSRMINI